MRHVQTGQRLALFGTLLSTYDAFHAFADQFGQLDGDAKNKDAHGSHLVYPDGKPVDEATDDRTGQPTMTATALGWKCAARHVAFYTVLQTTATVAVTRGLGYRVSPQSLLTGALINGATHVVLDRREPLRWLAAKLGKTGYIEHCTVVRKHGDKEAEETGPGTAMMEMDQALHRAIGISAAFVTTWLTTRKSR